MGVATPPTYLIGSHIQERVEVVVGGEDHDCDLNTRTIHLRLTIVSGNHGQHVGDVLGEEKERNREGGRESEGEEIKMRREDAYST